ncbi:MAG TPA: histidine kinase dimerization/phospho-acceptor domain-containing protein, partial [Usitatibacter sp.]
MPASFVHGIRFRLVMAALVLLAIPWLAAHFISRMETFLRDSQEQEIGATARAVAAALSDRPALFAAVDAGSDPEGEERRRIVALFAAADPDAAASLGNAYVPSEDIERFLAIMGRRSSRVWVVDTRSRVRGLSGALREGPPKPRASWLKPLAALIVPTPRLPASDETRPARGQIDRALIGVSSTQWRGTRDRDVAILSSARPIFVGDDIVGAVVVEETTGSIQILKDSALENLLAVTLGVVGAALVILLAFATRLAARIRRLHAEADAAIDSQGRVRGTIMATDARDEIGDLTRTTAAMLARLKEYNAYLEAMAGRLSHELRTPVAVVRSSLDNLKAHPLAPEARVYVERAGEGVERLARLISRLSEATRLERMLESAETERFDLAAVVAGCVEGYRAAYSPREFAYSAPAGPVVIEGVPDAVAQLLDKLVENANDFAPPGSAIRISLSADAR